MEFIYLAYLCDCSTSSHFVQGQDESAEFICINTSGILPFALWVGRAVQICSRQICEHFRRSHFLLKKVGEMAMGE